jgi:hypothetical protein
MENDREGKSRPSDLQGAPVATENWTEERERLVRLLEGIESGTITHVDEDDFRQLQATSEENIAALRARLAELNTRLDE